MTNLNLKIIAYASFICWLSFACSKDNDEDMVPYTPQTNWEKSKGLEEGIFNSLYIDNKLYLLGASNFYKDGNISDTNIPFSFEKYITRPGWHKLPVSNKVLATRTELDVFILSVSNLTEDQFLKIDLKSFDPTFIKLEDIPRWQSEGLGISGNGTILIPYRTAKEGIAENNPSLMLIRTSNKNNEIVIEEVKNIKLQVLSYYDLVYQVDSFENFFLITVGNIVIQLTDQGEVSTVGAFNTLRSLIIKDEVISFGIDRIKNEVSYFKSRMDGGNRQLVRKIPLEPLFDGLELTSINDKIIGYKNDKIYLIELETNKMKLSELNNSKLEGGFITSIISINENKVLVTATCHIICGGYTKPLNNFFEIKKE